MEHLVYMDNAATTKVRPEVLETMLPFYNDEFGNPSGIYRMAGKAKKAVNDAREIIAQSIGAKENEIYFTGGGSEGDNWAIKGICDAYRSKGNHMITSCIEHHGILHTCEFLEKHGFEVTYLNVNKDGMISLDELQAAIRPDTILISIMFANNEIGTIQPVKEIGAIAREHQILFHTDAVQAFGQIPIDVVEDHIDLLSASAHKLNGPKGVGMLYIRSGVKIESLIHGGQQEHHRRAGTENVAGIVGFGKATEIAMKTMKERMKQEIVLRDYGIRRILKEIPDCTLNGHNKNRLPGNINISYGCIEGESLLILLDMAGICASSGSACTSGSVAPSHVLVAIGLTEEMAHGALRLTIGYETTKEEMDYVIEQLKIIVKKLRMMSNT